MINGVRNYLSVSQFASTYGQTPANIAALTSYLAGFGIKTDVYADNVDVVATGTAGEFDSRAVGDAEPVPRARAGGHRRAGRDTRAERARHRAVAAAAVPALELRAGHPRAHELRPVRQPRGAREHQPASSRSRAARTTAWRLPACPTRCNLPSDFAANYGLDGLYTKGADGSGQTLAIVTLAAVDPGAPQYFWKNIAQIPNTGRSFTVQNIDGGPGAPSDASGTGETDLDLEQSGSLAPGANVIDYQAPNTDSGFADAFFTAASQNTASTVSTSWGESETILEAAILAGQEASTYEARRSTRPSSSWPRRGSPPSTPPVTRELTTPARPRHHQPVGRHHADSPYITAAGGTTLPWTGTLTGPDGSATVTVPSQRIWGWDYLWPAIAKINGDIARRGRGGNIGGGGGGFSTIYGTPQYQEFVPGTHSFNAVQYLTPTDYTTIVPGLVEPTAWSFNPTPSVTGGSGSGRAVPDVSADADPYTGYLLYEPSFAGVGEPVLQGGWGGTSFVAPQLNGSTAVIDSALGHRVGFWNPSIYAVAKLFKSPFTPLDTAGTSNDNLYYTGQPGEPYNQGVGLGIPNLTALSGDFNH